MHTNIPGSDGKLSFGGMCFPKDIRAFNAQMNLPTQPAGRADDSTTFYNHVNSTLKLLNDELYF